MTEEWKMVNGIWQREPSEYDSDRATFEVKVRGFQPPSKRYGLDNRKAIHP